VAVFRSDLLRNSETFILNQVQSLQRWQPVLAGNRRVAGGLPIERVPIALPEPSSRLFQRIALQVSRLANTRHRATESLLASLDPDLVHIHFGTDAVDAWPTVARLAKPVVVTLHGYDVHIHRWWWEAGRGGTARRFYPRRLLDLSGNRNVHFIAVSAAISARAIDLGIPSSRITTLHIGVDCESFSPCRPILDRRKRVLFVGRLVEKKGVEHLLRSFASIAPRVPDAVLTIAGDGPLRGNLERLANSLSIPVEFTGAITANQVRDHMRDSRVFCLPSITASNGDAEGFGLVLLEAQACGVPVVSSARGGSEEGMLDGETGFRVPEGGVDIMAEKLLLLLTDEALASRMATRARQFVSDRFDLEACTRSLEAFYDSVYEEHVRAPCAAA